MAHVYQTTDRNGKRHPKWRFTYTDWQGKRKTQTGYPSKRQTEKLAAKVEAEHESIRKGYSPPPKSYARHHRQPFEQFKNKYLEWGETQGGKGGRGWSPTHHQIKSSQLDWWETHLNLQSLADLEDILSPVEEALQTLKNDGKANKTVKSYGEAIKSFSLWCVKRGFLEQDPLKDLNPFDITPEVPRRAFTLDEIGSVLKAANDTDTLLYEVALCTGLRAGELRNLSIEDLDVEKGGLTLHPEWTKNRQPGFQPLPQYLVEALQEFADNSPARELYQNLPVRKGQPRSKRPLLFLYGPPSVPLTRLMKKAGVEKKTDEGKLDFHAFRTTFGTLLNMAGATEKEIQHLMRHRPRTITFDRYVKTTNERLRTLVETIGDSIRTAKDSSKREIFAKQKIAVGANLYDTNGNVPPALGFQPDRRSPGAPRRVL